MVTFLKVVGKLSARGAKWAWANKSRIMKLIRQGLGIKKIIDYIESKI